mmetsp:Transcript_7266/g.11048  ORF Transcript_7266/g.11048 Transcript_7266/m.11048 type:complete len:149 (+) Transcript_7266:77-523(+)|eukprot:CAMPEP_0195302616 /NCGR_PEP_ID=MMETSP0707-20130614/31400_1 /TAXON_ID=33640 /ORGANISM="Asterionellopsis glacialis, Strain CCMP134" /LENGTH=148 /DNA_ID=CAMNT_0040365925 /DNA_START=87 /DNA_END=533 /DNA_ORIENTATION=-
MLANAALSRAIVGSSLIGNPYLNLATSWTMRLNRAMDDAIYGGWCSCDPVQDLYTIDDDPLQGVDRIYYNRVNKKILTEYHSTKWRTGFMDEFETSMSDDEVIEQYETNGFKIHRMTALGVSFQRIDYTETGKHLYHIDDRRALDHQV